MNSRALVMGTWKYVLYFLILAVPIYFLNELQIADFMILGYVVPGDYLEIVVFLAGYGIAMGITYFIGKIGRFGFKRGGM